MGAVMIHSERFPTQEILDVRVVAATEVISPIDVNPLHLEARFFEFRRTNFRNRNLAVNRKQARLIEDDLAVTVISMFKRNYKDARFNFQQF